MRAQRAETDRSLRAERDTVDQELHRARTVAEDDADLAVKLARERAEAVLHTARDRADHHPAAAHGTASDQERIRQEREEEDELIAMERRTADEALQHEREERHAFFASFLHSERTYTDEQLQLERRNADGEGASRDQFTGLVAHDLRILLAGIDLQAQRLARNPVDVHGGKTLRASDRIRHFCKRMNRLVGDLLDVASIESGKLAVKPAGHDVAALLREAKDGFQPFASARGIALEAEILTEPLRAHFDHDRILQVVGNLISNAIKFTEAGGNIRLRAEQVGTEVRLSVRDTGVGIPPDRREAVFDRFWQAEDGDRQGLGLGLFISKCIVEAHGGRIWVESEVRRGSTLTFTLPAASVSTGEGAAQPIKQRA